MQYKNKILYTDKKEVFFDFPIKQVVFFRNLYIVLISPPNELEYPLNIFAVNKEGDIVWKIKSFNQEPVIFDKIEINPNNGKLYGIDIDYFKYVIDYETGDIIAGKLKPLDDEPINNSKESKQTEKIISKINIDLLKNNKILTLLFFIGFFIFMIFITKNIKINTLQTEIERNQTYIQILEQTLVKQEQAVKEKEQIIAELENYIVQTQYTNTNMSQPTGNNNYTQQIYPEEYQSSQVLIKNETNNREETVKGGISTVVNFLDTLVNNVTTGTPITTDDLKEMTKKVSEGYHVTQYVDGQRIKVSLDGTDEFVVKLISVSNCSISTLEKLIPIGTKIYLENDSKKYNDNGEMLAYIWVTSPDEKNIKSMVNYAILKSGAGTFINESPNIKYNRYFF